MTSLKRFTLVAVLAVVGACSRGRPEPAATARVDGGRVTLGIQQVGPLDPALATGSALMVLTAACDGLVGLDPATGEPQPAIAASWKVESGAGKTTLQLRSGLKFQDGIVLDSKAVALNLARVAQTGAGSPWAYLLDGVEGFAEVAAGSATELSGVRARGQSVEISLTKPDADFISVLSHPALTPVSPKEIESARREARAVRPVCSGPYSMKIQGETLTSMERASQYRPVNGAFEAEGEGFVDDIVVKQFGSPTEAFAAFKEQQVEVAPIPNDLFAMGEAESFGHDSGSTTEVTMLAFNMASPKTSSAQLRRAISLALNRLAIIDAALGDEREPLAGWFAGGQTAPTSACRQLAPKAADVEQAKTELTQSGVDPASVAIPIRFDSGRVSRVLAQAIEVQVKEGLGVPLSSEPVDATGLEASIRDRTSEGMWVLSRSRDLPIVGRLISVEFDSQSPANLTGFADPEFNDLISRGRATAEPDRRRKLYESAETRVCEQMPAVPLWSGVSHWVYDSGRFNLQSPSVDANGNIVLRHVRKR